MSWRILGIDPGTTKSGWALYRAGHVLSSGVVANDALLSDLHYHRRSEADLVAIETMHFQGRLTGQETFEAMRWVGRFQEAWMAPEEVMLIDRQTIRTNLCGSIRAGDSEIRSELIFRIGPPGTKKAPGPTYGVSSHAWQALAVAVVAEATA